MRRRMSILPILVVLPANMGGMSSLCLKDQLSELLEDEGSED